MANITSLPQQYFGKIETVTVPNPTLANAISASDLVINLAQAITFPDLTSPTALAFTVVVRNASTGFAEEIYVRSGDLSADGKTITLGSSAQRGINNAPDASGNIDFLSGSATRTSDHPQGSAVRVSISPLFWSAMQAVQQGRIASGGTMWKVGRDVDENIFWYVANGDANKPYFKYVAASNKFVVAADGVTEIDMASGGVTTASGGVHIIAADISLNLADTTQIKSTRTGNERIVVASTAANGLIDNNFLSANLNEADTFFGATNITGAEAETLTASTTSYADSLHTHTGLIRKAYAMAGSGYLSGASLGGGYTAGAIVSFSDGAVQTWHASVVVPSGFTSISAINVLQYSEGTAGNVVLNLRTERGRIAAASVSDSSAGNYTVSAAGTNTYVYARAVPSTSFDGIGAVQEGDIIGIRFERVGTDGSDTFAATLRIEAIEITFA